MSIITVAIVAMIVLVTQNIKLSRFAMESVQVEYLLQDGAEAVKTIRDDAWVNLSSLAYDTDYYLSFVDGAWSATSTPSSIGIFTRSFSLGQVYRDNVTYDIASSGTADNKTMLVVVKTVWDSHVGFGSKELSFYVTDFLSD